jgi:hypothetical protein
MMAADNFFVRVTFWHYPGLRRAYCRGLGTLRLRLLPLAVLRHAKFMDGQARKVGAATHSGGGQVNAHL